MSYHKRTKAGKFIYSICIKRDMSLKELAADMEVSYTYIWMLMTGERPVPDTFIERFAKKYKLSEAQKKELSQLAMESYRSAHFNMTQLSKDKKNLVILFKHKIAELTPEQEEAIRKVLMAS